MRVTASRLRCEPPKASASEISCLFDKFAPFVRDLACQLLGGAGGEVDDVVQEVFFIAWRKFDPARAFGVRTWLARVTIRVAAASRRRAWLRRGLGLEAAPEDPIDPKTPESELEVREALRVFSEVAGELSEKKRVVLVLSDIHGFSGPEIAEAVGCPLETAYSRLLHARREFVELLARAGHHGSSGDRAARAAGCRKSGGGVA